MIKNGKACLAKVSVRQSVRVKPLVVVGIPAYNEEKTIGKVVLQSQEYSNIVLVCDDGGSDFTGEIAKRLGAEVIRHDSNGGYGAAIQTLFRRARELEADVLVTVDADGQHDPTEIPNVVEPIAKGEADITVGSRFVNKRLTSMMPWYRRAGIKFISKLVDNNTKQSVADAQSGFRAYNGKCLDKLVVTENGMGASVEILITAKRQGLRIKEVPASCDYAVDGRKHVHNPVRHGADVIYSFVKLVVEGRPLLFLGVPGVLCLASGAFFGVWMLQLYGIRHQIETNIALASIAFVLIGFFASSTAVTLYAISRLAEKMNMKK